MKDKIYQVFKDILKTNAQPQEITTENTSEWDSLTHLNLVLALEEEFGIEITPEEIEKKIL